VLNELPCPEHHDDGEQHGSKDFFCFVHGVLLTLLSTGLFLIGLLEGCGCGGIGYELIGAFAVFLHHAPTAALGAGGFLAAEQTQSVAEGGAGGLNIISASGTGKKSGCGF
jgi:hypothetical protein